MIGLGLLWKDGCVEVGSDRSFLGVVFAWVGDWTGWALALACTGTSTYIPLCGFLGVALCELRFDGSYVQYIHTRYLPTYMFVGIISDESGYV